MTTPPPLAERMLRWSLAPDDREAVLGDLQEEFAALGGALGPVAATRWYWTQALLSLPANVVRRLRGDRQRRLANETPDERGQRRSRRKTGLLMSAGAMLVFACGLLTSESMDGGLLLPFLAVPAGVLLFFGTTLFFGSFSPLPEYDRLSQELNQRRTRIFWLLMILSSSPEKIAPAAYVHAVKLWEFLPMLVAGAVAVWPRKYWMFGGAFTELMKPQVWSPFTSTRREAGGILRLPVDAPDGAAMLGDLILAHGGVDRIELRRVFTPDEGLRIFAPVGSGPTAPQIAIDLLDTHDRPVLHRTASTTVAAPVKRSEWWRRPVPPTALIDEIIPLDECAAGSYRIVITATDGSQVSTKSADFRIAPPSATR